MGAAMIFTTRDLDILRFIRWCRFVLAENLTVEQQNGTFAGMMRLKAIINLRGQQMMISAPLLRM